MTRFGRWLTMVFAIGTAFAVTLAACSEDDTANPPDVTASADDEPVIAAVDRDPVTYEAVVVETYPHDPSSYTQGLEFVDGLLLESTGQTDRSSIRLVDPETGEAELTTPIGTIFGEGATVVDDEIWQLTWKDEVLIVHDVDDLSEIRRQPYEGEGWGLCDTGDRLIMTDGGSKLTFRNRETFDVEGRLTVTMAGQPLEALNELECVDNRVWANVFQSNFVVEIDPTTGYVVGSADLTDLVPEELAGDPNLVLNGIAYNPDSGRFWLTGKEWPVMYELEFRPVESS